MSIHSLTTAVVLNVTAVGPTIDTFVAVWPANEAQPLASNLNVPAGDTRANLVVVKVGAHGWSTSATPPAGSTSWSTSPGGTDHPAPDPKS